MDRRFKAVIQVLGLLVSLSGLIVLYKDAHYQVLILLGIVSLGLLVFTIIQILTPVISFKRIHWYVDIEDIKGKIARARKETTLVANQRRINSLVERHLATMGEFDKFSSNIGDVYGPVSEGGSQTVTVLLKAPLEVGKSITMTLSMRILDSFLDTKESISYRLDQRCKEIGLHLHLPDNRRAQRADAYMFIKNRAKKLDPVFAEGGRVLSIIVNHPLFGAKYVLEWVW
jgi:hypothetical protein